MHFPAEVKAWWTPFLADFESNYGSLPSVPPPWPVDIFRNTTRAVEVVSEAEVSETITSLHTKQMDDRPKVRMFYCTCSICNKYCMESKCFPS
jgi:hypothetical protein